MVTVQEANKFVKTAKLNQYIECSALTGVNIQQVLFSHII